MLVNDNDDLPVLKQRQRTAFPPNYIHSIDSSHMMLTATACKEEGARGAGAATAPRRSPARPPPARLAAGLPVRSSQASRPFSTLFYNLETNFVFAPGPLAPPAPRPGITFAGVHDSFWTHAGSVERMNELLRDKFVELHSQVRAPCVRRA